MTCSNRRHHFQRIFPVPERALRSRRDAGLDHGAGELRLELYNFLGRKRASLITALTGTSAATGDRIRDSELAAWPDLLLPALTSVASLNQCVHVEKSER